MLPGNRNGVNARTDGIFANARPVSLALYGDKLYKNGKFSNRDPRH